jgi:hypothetical protein
MVVALVADQGTAVADLDMAAADQGTAVADPGTAAADLDMVAADPGTAAVDPAVDQGTAVADPSKVVVHRRDKVVGMTYEISIAIKSTIIQ